MLRVLARLALMGIALYFVGGLIPILLLALLVAVLMGIAGWK